MMLALAWILALLGVAVAYVVSLAGAMKTVPELRWDEVLVAVPLPLIAAALALGYLMRRRPPRWIAATLALLTAGFALLLTAVSYFDQPGGPR